MKPQLLWIAAVSSALLAYGASAVASAPPRLPGATAAAPTPSGEVARIQAHLAEVERELFARDVSELTAEQRAARARHLRVLREYREAGVFPHNHDFPAERVPYFVDQHGTLCAMAYLISRSGRHDLVERIAATRNNARVAELADDPELVAWLQAAGLSLGEAARIQPMYDGGGCCMVEPGQAEQVSVGYAAASVLASGVGGVSIGINFSSLRAGDGPRWPGLLGLTAGIAGVALGADHLGNGGGSVALAATNAGIGVLSAALGAWTLVRAPGERDSGGVVAPYRNGPSISAAPLLPADGGGAGVLLRVGF